MAKGEATPARHDWKAVLTSDEDGFRALLQTVVQDVLEAEMTEALQAEKNERTAHRLGHSLGLLRSQACEAGRSLGAPRSAGPVWSVQGAQEGGTESNCRLTAAGRRRRCAIRGLRAARARHHQCPQFAELDAHNSVVVVAQP